MPQRVCAPVVFEPVGRANVVQTESLQWTPEDPVDWTEVDMVMVPAELRPCGPPPAVEPGEDWLLWARAQLPCGPELTSPQQVAVADATKKPAVSRFDPDKVIRTHVVKRGQTLGAVARQYGYDLERLALVNDLHINQKIYPGDLIYLPDDDGVALTVGRGDTLWGICRRLRVRLAKVLEANAMENPSYLKIGQRLFVPGVDPKVYAAQKEFIWPLYGRLTSGYGWRKSPMGGNRTEFHFGIDMAARRGTVINAARGGIVTLARRRGAMGRTVMIDHGDGYTSVYGHASSLLVRRGERVGQGQPIARVGSTGRSTGPHLHFEIRKNGKAVNPFQCLPRRRR